MEVWDRTSKSSIFSIFIYIQRFKLNYEIHYLKNLTHNDAALLAFTLFNCFFPAVYLLFVKFPVLTYYEYLSEQIYHYRQLMEARTISSDKSNHSLYT